jgi:hypothetical protein
LPMPGEDWELWARRLRRNPRRWYRIDDVSNGIAYKVAHGKIPALARLTERSGGYIEASLKGIAKVQGERGTSLRGQLHLRWVPGRERE